MKNRKKLYAQGSVEFMTLFPIFMVLVLIMVSITLKWHTFHVTSQTTLESASRGVNKARKIADGELGRAVVTFEKADDAKVNPYTIENDTSKIMGFTAKGVANNFMVNTNYFDSGTPNTSGYVQAPEVWEFIPCDIGCPK